MKPRSFAALVVLGAAALFTAATVIACSTDEAARATATEVRSAELDLGEPATAPRLTNPGVAEPRIEELEVPEDLPVYIVRGGANGAGGEKKLRAVFLTGSCTNPTEYLTAFYRAVAARGDLIALQGDKPCKDPKQRRWSADSVATGKRIERALSAAGISDADGMVLIGYSQGAERAEWLGRRYPEKFQRFILIASPVVPSTTRLGAAQAVVTMAGKEDERGDMADGAKALRRGAVPAIYMELPSPHHGEIGAGGDLAIGQALDWLDAHARNSPAKSRRP